MLLKKIAAFAAAALACVSLAGCGSAKDITVDVNALAAELRDGIAYQDELESIDSAMISMVYDVGDEVEEAVVYMGSGATAEEIAVFACKDADAAKNQVTPVVKQHIEDQITRRGGKAQGCGGPDRGKVRGGVRLRRLRGGGKNPGQVHEIRRKKAAVGGKSFQRPLLRGIYLALGSSARRICRVCLISAQTVDFFTKQRRLMGIQVRRKRP